LELSSWDFVGIKDVLKKDAHLKHPDSLNYNRLLWYRLSMSKIKKGREK